MIRARNTHGAPVCGVAPGAEGEVDAANRGVASALAARLLVPVDEAAPAGDQPISESERASFDRFAREAQERVAKLEAELEHLRACDTVKCGACDRSKGPVACAHCGGTGLVAAVAEVDRLRIELATTNDARTDLRNDRDALRAKVAELTAALDAATAPAADSKHKKTREG